MVLYLYFRNRDSYTTLEAIVFLFVFGVSVCNLLWLVPALVLG